MEDWKVGMVEGWEDWKVGRVEWKDGKLEENYIMEERKGGRLEERSLLI